MRTSGPPMSSTIEVSTLLQGWTVRRWQRELSRVESRGDFGECVVLLISPLSESNGVLIRIAEAVRRSFKVGSLLLRSVKGQSRSLWVTG